MILPNIEKQQYNISIADNNVSGFIIFGGGFMDTKSFVIEICKNTHSEDYKIVSSDWINRE